MTLPSPLFAIQYLEPSPSQPQLDKGSVINKLRLAFERVPITHLLIGWQVPAPIIEACRTEAQHFGMRFLRWQPMLTIPTTLQRHPEWCVKNLMGNKVAGYHALPEFTFACPNHPGVQESVYRSMEELVKQGLFQGFFLDRIRFPSPSANPITDLACFCEHCYRKAAEFNLDLAELKASLLGCREDETSCTDLVRSLITKKAIHAQARTDSPLNKFLAFRQRSICDFLVPITRLLRAVQLEIGLDCYSPCLAMMVGQDLTALSRQADWVKIMTYAHTIAPAGLPYELSSLAHFLTSRTRMPVVQVLKIIGNATRLPIPDNLSSLESTGLSSIALGKEVKHGVASVSVPLLAGIEFVDLEGVTALNSDQIRSDLEAVRRSGAAGLAISWDLAHIPLERLDLVRQVYLRQ